MGGIVTKEEDISRAQYLDLVYSQSSTLYELITNANRTSTNPSKPSSATHAYGVIGTIKTQYTSRSTRIVNHYVSAPIPSSTSLSSTSLPTQVSELNEVQSTSSQPFGGKKKTKSKHKNINNNNEQPKTQTPSPAIEKQPQRKLKSPCLIFGDDHFTQDYPRCDEIAKIFKGNSQPTLLTQPFPQQQSMVSQALAPPTRGVNFLSSTTIINPGFNSNYYSYISIIIRILLKETRSQSTQAFILGNSKGEENPTKLI
jgi:hypothetical protein